MTMHTHINAPEIQCHGKEAFQSPQLAMHVEHRAARNRKFRKKARTGIAKAYRCPHCGFFHLGRLA
jgi:rubrerythrin